MNNFGITTDEINDTILDTLKVLTILLVVHLLTVSIDSQGELLSLDAVKLMLYSTIGVISYHLGVKKIVNKIIEKK